MKKITMISSVMLFSVLITGSINTTPIYGENNNPQTVQTAKVLKENVDVVEDFVPMETGVSDEDLELLALVTMAEAEGESEEGQRLVVDTILNRMDSELYPNTIHGVVYQKNQFTSMFNGRSDRCVVTDEMRQLVKEELTQRTNYDVMYFRTKYYHSFATPMFKVDNHYFSSR